MRYVDPLFRPPSEADSFILQATLGCSYSTALKKVRDAEALRKAQVNLATEHMTPIEVVMATGKEGEK